MRKLFFSGRTTTLLVSFLCLVLVLAGCRGRDGKLVLATTTSTDDSGLLDAILPSFEAQYGVDVDVVAVGTGQALALGAAGDVDVVLVHAPEREEAFVRAGHGVARQPVMYNDFVLLGPVADPAGIRGMTDVAAALAEIAAQEEPFISRGDDSGTHIREMMLWTATGITPGGQWYRSIGQGMGEALTLAAEEQAYLLSDRGTFLAQRPALEVLVEGDPRLLNLYSVIAVNPERHPVVAADLAQTFITWLQMPETQSAIQQFRVGGEPLFVPNADGHCPPSCPRPSDVATEPQAAFSLVAALRQAILLIGQGDAALWEVVALSMVVSGIALFIAALVGIPAGAFLGLRQFRGQRWLQASIYTGMGFPPVVIGLLVYLLLSQQGPLGWLNWLFSPPAMIVAQTILALPLITGVTMASVREVSGELRWQLRSLGATEWQVVGTLLQEARSGVIVGLMAGFGAAVSEVGAVMLVGGNIDGRTRVLTTAIVLETRRGQFDLALALGIILLGLAFVANLAAVRWQSGR